jgi:DNA-binding NtrC family response regulator
VSTTEVAIEIRSTHATGSDIDLSYPYDDGLQPRVLLVIEDEIVLGLLKQSLLDDFDIECQSNPYRALVALEDDGPFAAVVSDLAMSGLSGIELLETAYDHCPEIPRILLTRGATLAESADAVNRAHITNLMLKPVTPEALKNTLSDAVLHNNVVASLPTGDPRRAIDLTS